MSEYLPNDTIKRFIKENNLDGVRETLGNIAYTDSSFKSGVFDDAVAYMKAHIPNFMQKFNPQPPLLSKTGKVPTDNEFAEAVANLKMNFCDERIGDVKALGKCLNAGPASSASAKRTARPHTSDTKPVTGWKEAESSKKAQSRPIGTLITAVVGLAAVIAIILLIVKVIRH